MSHQDVAAISMLIPILGTVLGLATLIVWIVVWHRRRAHEVDCRHKERMAAIEKGLLELPPEPPSHPEQMPPHSRYLLRGLIWLGVGVAITFGTHFSPPPFSGTGWIPTAVGAAYLIFYLVEAFRPSLPKREEPASRGDQTP